jgi:hypothetical protein
MRRWLLLSLAIMLLTLALPVAPASAAPMEAISPITRNMILAAATQMVQGAWVSPVTVYRNTAASPARWGTFYSGRTYVGMAYTQQNPQENWATFSANMKSHVGTPGVTQGTDCSGFASIAWGIPRQTTGTFMPNGYAYQLSSLSSLLPGDALLRPYDHIGIVAQRLANGNYSMLEQTDPHALRAEWSYSYASTYRPVRRYGIVATMPPPTPPPAPAPSTPPSPPALGTAPSGSFAVKYFANQTLSGSPKLTRDELYPLSHDWASGGPGSGVPNDHFSVRASGKFYFAEGNYTFNVASDDGVRLWLDGKLIEDHWTSHPATSWLNAQTLSTGYHTVAVEYYESTGLALLTLRWWKTRTCADGQFLGEFFNNTYLGGAPTARICQSPLSFDWGNRVPIAGVTQTNFSVRFAGDFRFDGRSYTFVARADDGIRVWVDRILLIDRWRDQGPTQYQATRNMTAGMHNVVVTYYQHLGGAVAQLRWQ